MKNTIQDKPNWLYEAASCIATYYKNDLDSILENHNKFGMTMEEMSGFLSKYSQYREKVLTEILPIYRKYPRLEKYFINESISMEENTNPIAIPIVMNSGESLTTEMKHTEIDRIIHEYIVGVLRDFDQTKEKDEIIINNIDDIMDHINKINMEDASKMQLISLYYNRYTFMEELASLLWQCAPICEKYFFIIKEDFDKAVQILKKADNINDLFSFTSLKVNLPENMEIFTNIFYFNQLSITDGADHFIAYVGIYFFDYIAWKEKTRFQDTQIINKLKALGDGTRLKLIHLLANNKMYVQELAEALEVTPATVSHHINILLKAELITITLDTNNTKKIFYKVNEDKLVLLGDTIKSLAYKSGGITYE